MVRRRGCSHPRKKYSNGIIIYTMNYFDETIWRDFKHLINEHKKPLMEADPSYRQSTYAIDLKIRIEKRKGGNKEQTLDEIRGIPFLTVVSIVPDTSSSDEAAYLTTLKCKFALTQSKDPMAYKQNVLIPSLINIKGLSIKYINNPSLLARPRQA